MWMGTTICCGTADYNTDCPVNLPFRLQNQSNAEVPVVPSAFIAYLVGPHPRTLGETRVDLLHLFEDLADAYPGDLDETILTEIVANSLDSVATHIRIAVDPAAQTFCVIDDGQGMRRSDLRRFHDIAATSKTRGEGI